MTDTLSQRIISDEVDRRDIFPELADIIAEIEQCGQAEVEPDSQLFQDFEQIDSMSIPALVIAIEERFGFTESSNIAMLFAGHICALKISQLEAAIANRLRGERRLAS